MSVSIKARRVFTLPRQRATFSVRSSVAPAELEQGSKAVHTTEAINLSTVTYELMMEASCPAELEYEAHGSTYSGSSTVDAGTDDPLPVFEARLIVRDGLADGLLPCHASVRLDYWRVALNPTGPDEPYPSEALNLRLLPPKAGT